MTTTNSVIPSPGYPVRLLASAVLGYFVVYFNYLFLFSEIENEMMHWLTLVLLPLLMMAILLKAAKQPVSMSDLLASVGLRRGNLSRGIVWAVILGLALGSLQIMLSSHRQEIIDALANGSFFYKMPVAFVVMLLTAGTTEEFFFRGVLQTRLSEAWGKGWVAVVIASILFGFYHLPYAYLLESWPSHGDFGAAVSEGVIPAIVMGVILGAVYQRFRNLLVPIIIHSLFNAFWALNLLKINGG